MFISNMMRHSTAM